MRLSTSQIFQSALSAMQTRQAELTKTQLQLATGEKNLAPSDDPAAATRILSLNHVIDTTVQFQRNADFADTRLSLEEAALTDVGDMLQRIRELSVQANNDILNAEDRQAIAAEVRVSLDGLIQMANSKDADGDYLFSGFKTGTEPFSDDGSGNFTYAGDQGQRNLQIGAKRQVAVGDSGDEVFMKIDDGTGTGTGDVSSMFGILYDFMLDLEANNPSATTLTRLDSAIDSISNTRATIGARMNTIERQRDTNDSFSLVLQESRSNLEDLDYAEAISRFEQQLLALQASQQTFAKIQGLSLFNYL